MKYFVMLSVKDKQCSRAMTESRSDKVDTQRNHLA